jgi:hypothetical protein
MVGEIFPTDDEIKYLDLLPNGLKAIEVDNIYLLVKNIFLASSCWCKRDIWRGRSILWKEKVIYSYMHII